MNYLPISDFPIIEPEDADPEVAQQLIETQRESGTPFVPNWAKAIANSPGVLSIYQDMRHAMGRHITLPQSLVPMILYTIATARHCTYCSTLNESYCRTLGVDDATLEDLAKNLDNVNPKRLGAIIEFALKCALDPQGLTAANYARVREFGLTDDELGQIIFLAALANFNDTLADSFKMELEPGLLETLNR